MAALHPKDAGGVSSGQLQSGWAGEATDQQHTHARTAREDPARQPPLPACSCGGGGYSGEREGKGEGKAEEREGTAGKKGESEDGGGEAGEEGGTSEGECV